MGSSHPQELCGIHRSTGQEQFSLRGEAMNPEGMKILASAYSAAETMNRLVKAAGALAIAVLARIDHAAAAATAGLHLSPMEVLIFGAPQAGTPLMKNSPAIGIDLPLRALAWQSANGTSWFGYNEPAWLATGHGLGIDTNAELIARATSDQVAPVPEGRSPDRPRSAWRQTLHDKFKSVENCSRSEMLRTLCRDACGSD